jgi:hypothetical protein
MIKKSVMYKRILSTSLNFYQKKRHGKCRLLSNFLLCFAIYATERLTLSRSSLPGLKCGTYLPVSSTDSPVFGFLPTLGAR